MDQLGHEAARTLLIRKASARATIASASRRLSQAAPRDVLVWSHQHEPASVNRDEIWLSANAALSNCSKGLSKDISRMRNFLRNLDDRFN
jgi:hypothetical protein